MKKNLLLIPILSALFLIMCLSCKSTPPAEQPPAEQPPAGDATSIVPERTAEARQRCIEFDAPAYFPTEWSAAEELYAAGSWDLATAAYEDLFNKTIPLYAQAREDEVTAIREEIKATGFNDAYPAYLRSVDDIALQALAEYEAEDYSSAKKTAATAMEEYSTLLTGARAYQVRREIIDRGFLQYDQDNFERADEIGMLALSKYDEGDKAGAIEAAEEALLRYNIVLENGWTQYAGSRREAAVRERELALADKANIASREFFREADAMFNQAETAFASENFRNAGILYIDSEALFAVSRQDTEDKRLRAEEAIRLAEERVELSDETAAEAERIIDRGGL